MTGRRDDGAIEGAALSARGTIALGEGDGAKGAVPPRSPRATSTEIRESEGSSLSHRPVSPPSSPLSPRPVAPNPPPSPCRTHSGTAGHGVRSVAPSGRGGAGGRLVILATLVLVALLAGVAFGAVGIPPERTLAIIGGAVGLAEPVGGPDSTILLYVRLPRVLAAALIGAALATAGTLLQGLLRNPLADPYAVGASAGAGLGATVAFMLGLSTVVLGFGPVPALGFVGALATSALVYRLARVGGAISTTGLLLAGFATSAILGAAVSLLMVLSDPLVSRLRQLVLWMMGGIAVTGWDQLPIVAPAILVGIGLALRLAGTLDALALGEEGAAYVGVDVPAARRSVLLLASLLTAMAVSISGLIGFVGLVVPHALRIILGPAHARLLPAVALGGASFLVVADLLARTVIAPTELPVGAITALVGGPFFLYLLNRSRQAYAF
ncbi:MAG: iron ABC transporter permease [Chloroflexi bacterium]|nr:iron ABC transporter permease [Chloroflexota bacterium]